MQIYKHWSTAVHQHNDFFVLFSVLNRQ